MDWKNVRTKDVSLDKRLGSFSPVLYAYLSKPSKSTLIRYFYIDKYIFYLTYAKPSKSTLIRYFYIDKYIFYPTSAKPSKSHPY
jgi:hypothetical protein